MDGFDVRTLAFNNVFLAIILGLGLIAFAKTHASYKGFRRIGFGHLFAAAGFLLIALRHLVSDWLSVVVANTLFLSGVALMGIGILRYLQIAHHDFIRQCRWQIIILVLSFSYFTFVEPNINIRIFIVSLMLASVCFSLALKMKQCENLFTNRFIKIIYYSLFLACLIFLFRAFWTLLESPIISFMNAGVVHGVSLVVFQLIMVETSFLMSWSASLNLERNLETKAMIDPLTQLYNRRALTGLAEKEIARNNRSRSTMSVILIDLDHFKRVNDSFGHQAGDDVLSTVASRLSINLRNNDILARYGGEEFLLLLPDTHGADAIKIANKLKLIISDELISVNNFQQPVQITASFGISAMSGRNIDWDELVALADKALYAAKRNGRNQVKGNFQHVQLVTQVHKNNTSTI